MSASESAREGSTGASSTAPSTPFALPAPEPSNSTRGLEIGQTVRLDELGPVVVNSDGTLSRITGWKDMSPEEKERTTRIITARNKIRIANKEKKLQEMRAPETTSNE